MSKYLNKTLKNKAKNAKGTLKKSNGEHTIPGLDTLRELANKYYLTHIDKKEKICPDKPVDKNTWNNNTLTR